MRRIIVFITIVCSAAVGAWALPAGQASPTVDHASAESDHAPPPAVAEPDVSASASADREIAPLEIAEFDAIKTPTAEALPPAPADHLVANAQETPEPDVIVTTTTAPPTTTTTAPVVTVAFSATQAYGSCGENVPYDIFSGTATPGSTVTISSPYGSGSVTADGHGHWERTVEFPSAPRGETFNVTASGLGGSKTLHFTATGEAHA